MAATTGKKYNPRRTLSDYYVYAPLGAGQLLIEKTRELTGKAWRGARGGVETVTRTYRDLADRGEKLASGIVRSAYTRRAVDQSKVATRQVKAAATSVRKAVGTTAEATRAAAKKVG
jgi:hypothetical protein